MITPPLVPPLTQQLLHQPHAQQQQLLAAVQVALPLQPAPRLHPIGGARIAALCRRQLAAVRLLHGR